MTTRTKSSLPLACRRAVYRRFKVFRLTGPWQTGDWSYQPHDYDGSYEAWTQSSYQTRREAVEAAFREIQER